MAMRLYFYEMREDAARALEELFDRFSADMPAPRLSEYVQRICLHLHTVAMASLLLEGQVQDFHLNLCRAAENWRRLLVHLSARNLRRPPVTHNAPLLGAVASGHWTLAREIARVSATEWREEEEYLDDFDWAVLLQELVLAEQSEMHQLEASIERLRSSGAETHSERLDVVQALRARDAAQFVIAFRCLGLVWSKSTESLAGSFTTPVAEFAPYRYIWLEGLALLRLAEQAGITCEPERFLYCPLLARLPRRVEYEGDWAVPLGSWP